MPNNYASPERVPRRRAPRVLFLLGMALLFAAFIGLGTWQVQRRAWKLDLIQRVDARVHAPPTAPPAVVDWPGVSVDRDEYRRVRVRGEYLSVPPARVQAATAVGSGVWLLSPLQQGDGSVVLINRGFVPSGWSGSATAPRGEVTVTGLLRITEPGGGFLRRNDPAADRWYSRDVAAIAAARRLTRVAPYFIDADAPSAAAERAAIGEERDGTDASASASNASAAHTSATSATQWPRGGLTVISFYNNHLVYALTWFGLALMTLGALWRVAREWRRQPPAVA